MPVSSVSLNPSLLAQPVSTGPMSVTAALNAIATQRSGIISIQDTADNISKNIDALQAARTRISAIGITSGGSTTLALTSRQMTGDAAILAKISSDYAVNVSAATAADVSRLSANAKVSSIAVADSSRNIGLQFAALQGAVSKISGITQTGTPSAIGINYSVLGSAVLAKITDSYSLSVSNVTTLNMSDVAANPKVTTLSIVDTSRNIAENLDALQGLGVKLVGTQSTDKAALDVTADQVKTDALVLGKIYSGYSLAVHGATLTDVALLAHNNKVKTIDVADTAANVIKNLDALRKLGSNLGTITLSDAGAPIAIAASVLAKNADILGKIANSGYRYAVSGATVAALSGSSGLLADTRVSSIAVSDTGAKIAAAMDALQDLGDQIVGVTVTDTGAALAVAEPQLTRDSDLLGKIGNRYTLAVSGVIADDVAALAQRGDVRTVAISDSSGNIASNWDALIASALKLKSITQTSPTATMDIRADQLAAGGIMLSKMTGSFALNVTGVSAADASRIASSAHVVSVTVSDTSANIAANLNALNALGSKLGSITQSGSATALAITATQLASDTVALGKISNAYTLSVSNVFAEDAATVAGFDEVTALQVADTSANLAANLDALQGLGKLTAIKVLGTPSPMSITFDQLNGDSGALGKITNSYSLAVRNVSAEDATTVAAQAHVAQVAVRDSSASIASYLSTLNALGNELTSITQYGTISTLELTAAQLRANRPALGKIVNAYTLHVTDVTAASAFSVASQRNVVSLAVSDSSSNIALHLDELDNLGATLTDITQTGTKSSLAVTAMQFLAASETLAKIDGGDYRVNVREVRAASVATITADSHVASVDVIDTADNVVGNLSSLKDALSVASGGSTVDKLHTVTVSSLAPLSITAGQLEGYSGVLDKITSNHAITVRDVLAADATTLAGKAHVTYVAVADSSGNIASNLNALNTLGRKLSSITQTGTISPLLITAAQLAASPATLAKISNNYTLAVSGVTAAAAPVVAANGTVVSMTVRDTSANIAGNLDSLQTISAKISAITQSSKSVLSMTAAQLSADSTALSKLDADGYTVNVSGVLAGNASSLVAANSHVATLSVADFSSSIASNFDALRGIVSNLVGITQTGVATPLSITQAQMDSTGAAALLGKITNTYNLALREVLAGDSTIVAARAHVATVAVSDSSGAISTNLDDLHALGSRLLSVAQTGTVAPISLNMAQLTADSDVLGKLSNGYSLAVNHVTAARAGEVAANPLVSSVEVSDGSASIAANLDALQGLGSRLTAIHQTGTAAPLQITANQLREDAAALAKISGSFSLAVSGVTAEHAVAVAAQSIGAAGEVTSVAISDSAANVAANLDSLAGLRSELSSVTLSDSATPLDISVGQWTAGTASGGVLGKITNGYSVAVSGAGAAAATAIASDSHVLTVAVTDSGSAIAGSLDDLQGLGKKLLAINPDMEDAAMTVTVGQLNADAAALGKISGSYHLDVTGVSAANASSVAARSNVATLQVSDTSANIDRNWDVLAALQSQLGSITQTGTVSPLDITAVQLAADAAVIGKIRGNYSLAVSGVKAEDAYAVGTRTDVASVAVRDTAQNISRYVDRIEDPDSQVGSVAVSDAGLLSMTAAQYAGGLVDKITTGYTLALTDMSVNDVLTGSASTDAHVVSISIGDSSDMVAGNLDALQAMGDQLAAIHLIGTVSTMTISADQLYGDAETLAKIADPYALAVTDVLASDALSVSEVESVESLSVSDTAAHLSAKLDDLQNIAGKLDVVTQTDGHALTVSFAQLSTDSAALAKFDPASLTLEVSDVTAENLADLLGRNDVVTINISDTSTAITGKFDELMTLAGQGRLGSIEQVVTIAPLAITADQMNDANGQAVLGSIANHYTLAVSDVLAAAATGLAAQDTVASVAVSDTAGNIHDNLDDLQALGASLVSITQIDSDPIELTASQYGLDSDLWNKFSNSFSLAVQDSRAANASYLAGRGHVGSLTVSDTAAAVVTHLDDLQALGSQLNGINLTDSAPAVLSLTATQLVSDAGALSKISGASVVVAEVTAENATSVAAQTGVSSVSVSDSSANVSNFLADLAALGNRLQSIALTDGSSISLSADQIATYSGVLSKLADGFTVEQIEEPA